MQDEVVVLKLSTQAFGVTDQLEQCQLENILSRMSNCEKWVVSDRGSGFGGAPSRQIHD